VAHGARDEAVVHEDVLVDVEARSFRCCSDAGFFAVAIPGRAAEVEVAGTPHLPTKDAAQETGRRDPRLLRSPWPGLALLPLFLLFLFLHLLLLDLFLVLLATLVSHACSFSAIMARDGE
jgi:hypothetical protein